MNPKLKFLTLAFATSVLAGCGGGGDDSPSPAPSPTPAPSAPSVEGTWIGRSSAGFDMAVTVLENNETWGFYVNQQTGSVGALFGGVTTSGLKLEGSITDFHFNTRQAILTSVMGSFEPKSKLFAQFGNNTTLSADYVSDYDQPATLSAIAGSYAGPAITNTTSAVSIIVNVKSDGTITMPVSNGCSAQGTIAPRPNGKNVYNLSVTFNAGCGIPSGVTTKGIGTYRNGTLVLEALNPSKTDGFFYIATKR